MPGDTVVGPAVVADPTEIPEAVAAYFRALNAEDFDLLGGLWVDEVEFRATGSRPRRGTAEVMAYFRRLFEPWLAHRDTPTRVLVADSVVVVEVAFIGRTRAGKEVAFDAVDVFDLVDGRISRLTTWYDLVRVRSLL